MQEIRSLNFPVVTRVCDPSKSQARHYRSFDEVFRSLFIISATWSVTFQIVLLFHISLSYVCVFIICQLKKLLAMM